MSLDTHAARIAALELDNAAPAAPVAPAPVATIENHLTRQELTRQAAVQAGFRWPKTILPEGTALYASGEATLRADRARWANMPAASAALPVVQAALDAQGWRDFPVQVRDLRLHATTGRIVKADSAADKRGFGYTEHAFRQLAARVPGVRELPRNAAANLLALDSDERAAIVNRRLEKMTATETAAMTLRSRLAHDGSRVAVASLSERYADIPDAEIARAVAAIAPANAKIEYIPGDSHSRFDVIFPAEIPVPLFRVGDIHKAVLSVTNSMTGEGSCKSTAGMFRAACANLTLSTATVEGVSVRHVGSSATRVAQVRAALVALVDQIEPLVNAIVVASTVVLPADRTPAQIIETLAKRYALTDSQAKGWAASFNQYAATYGDNLWSLHSALTESAQTADSWWTQHQAEQAAGELLASGTSFAAMLRK